MSRNPSLRWSDGITRRLFHCGSRVSLRKGVGRSEIKETPLGTLITLRDPDNIQLELYAPNT